MISMSKRAHTKLVFANHKNLQKNRLSNLLLLPGSLSLADSYCYCLVFLLWFEKLPPHFPQEYSHHFHRLKQYVDLMPRSLLTLTEKKLSKLKKDAEFIGKRKLQRSRKNNDGSSRLSLDTLPSLEGYTPLVIVLSIEIGI